MSEYAASDMPQMNPTSGEANRDELANITSVPRITIQAFCESDAVRQTLEMAASDRRMARAHVSVNMGGVKGAVDFYSAAPIPNLIIIESRQTGDALINELGALASLCDASTKVIVIGHFNDILMYRELISQGVSEYLVAPVTMAEVMKSITKIFLSEDNGPLGKMFAFIGAKGGCGSSTICHNVAWILANQYKSEVVLADLDMAFGTANMNLDQDPTQGIADAIFTPDRVDDILLDRLLAKCAQHLNLLAAPSTLERTYDFEAEAFSKILEVAQRGVPSVFVDIPNQWNGWTKQVLASADEVIITAEPELANLRNAKNLLDTITEIRPNDKQPHLVINKVGIQKRPEISISDFTSALSGTPIAEIPFEPSLFGRATNNGQMLTEVEPNNPISESMVMLTQIITGKAEVKTEKKTPFSFLKNLKQS